MNSILPGLVATIEGDPASGHFCIRVAPANEAGQRGPPEPEDLERGSRGMAAKVLELLSALDPDQRLRRAPPIKVFNLYYRQRLKVAEIARICGCDRSLVYDRLASMRQRLPWTPKQLQEVSPHVEAMQETLEDSRAELIYRKGAVYGDEDQEQEDD